MTFRNDLLEARPPADSKSPVDLTQTNILLQALLSETRKQVPKVGCQIITQGGVILTPGFGPAAGQVGPALGRAVHVTFQYMGNPVKSIYTIIANCSTDSCSVSINQPNVIVAGDEIGSGIVLLSPKSTNPGINILILPDVEIEYLEINRHGSSASSMPVGGNPDSTNGSIQVYGWTLREYANITE